MNHDRFAEIITKQSVEMQNAIFAGLKEVLTEEDFKTVAQFVSLYDMMHNPLKYEAMKKAVLEMLM